MKNIKKKIIDKEIKQELEEYDYYSIPFWEKPLDFEDYRDTNDACSGCPNRGNNICHCTLATNILY